MTESDLIAQIKDRLTTTTGLEGVAFYDGPPEGVEPPYITLDQVTGVPFEADDWVSVIRTITLSLWLKDTSRLQLMDKGDLIRESLNRFKTEGVEVVYRSHQTLRDPNPGIQRYIIRLDCLWS